MTMAYFRSQFKLLQYGFQKVTTTLERSQAGGGIFVVHFTGLLLRNLN